MKLALPGSDPQALNRAEVELYLPFVRKVVMRIARRLPSHIQASDLMGAGVIGLMEALDRFDPARATDFESYAEFRIKGAVLDELRRRDLMARDARLQVNHVEKVIAKLTQSLARQPEEPEIAEALGITVEEYRARIEKLLPVRVVSFEDLPSPDMVGPDSSPFDEVSRRELATRLAEAIASLSQRHQTILNLHYREELNLREIGEVLGVSESRVCQLLSDITLRLRAAMHRSDDGVSDTETLAEGGDHV